MFNLTAFQDNTGEIVVKPLDDFYTQSPGAYDITKYLDNSSHDVEALNPYKSINFGYKGNKSFFSDSHKELFGTTWGELKHKGNTKQEGSVLEIKLPFEHHKFERLIDPIPGTKTDVQWGWSVDIKQEPYLGDPLLFYAVKITGGTTIGLMKSSSNRAALSTYYIPSNSVDITDSQNINFKAEFNEYAGTSFKDTLFKTFYNTYIGDTFDVKRRLYKFKAYLPLRVLLNFTLADRFIIYDTLYKINSITTNLTTGLSNLELINEVSDFVIEDQDKYFADLVDKRIKTIDSDKITVDWIGD